MQPGNSNVTSSSACRTVTSSPRRRSRTCARSMRSFTRGAKDLESLDTADDLLEATAGAAAQAAHRRVRRLARRRLAAAQSSCSSARSSSRSRAATRPRILRSVIEHELAAGNIDVAIVWGPIAGYLAREHSSATPWHVVPFSPDPQIRFDYRDRRWACASAKRNGRTRWISGSRATSEKIQAILREYGVPLLDE